MDRRGFSGTPYAGKLSSPLQPAYDRGALQPQPTEPPNTVSEMVPYPAWLLDDFLGRRIHRESYARSNKENDPAAASIPITAPVPLLYSVVDKSALKSILYTNDEDEVLVSNGHYTSHEGTLVGACPNHRENTCPLGDTGQADQWLLNKDGQATRSHEHAMAMQRNKPISRMIIRPITPSTLIALTEPCLMAWCSEPYIEPSVSAIESKPDLCPCVPGTVVTPDDMQNNVLNPPNVWGY